MRSTLGIRLCSWSFAAILLSACDPFSTTFTVTTERTQTLRDPDGDGLLASPECEPSLEGTPRCGVIPEDPTPPPGCVIYPDPGGCAFAAWSETIEITSDAFGSILEERHEVCVQCLDEQGSPVGPETCYEEAPQPPVVCTELATDALGCWECVTADGQSFTECVEPSVPCYNDGECAEGELCLFGPQPECGEGMGCPEVMIGTCSVADPNLYCATDAECPEGMLCSYEQPGCEGGICPMSPAALGICLAPAPVDPCAAHTDAESCGADLENSCGWFDYGMPCAADDDTCLSGVCQQLGCDDGTGGGAVGSGGTVTPEG
jgi:hypothetical protein